MTKRELIEMLSDPAKQIRDDAVIFAWNPDEERLVPVTGLVYGPSLVEICTDSDD